MRLESVRAQVSASLRAIGHRPSVRGGNGTGPTEAQAKLSEALGWPMEVVVVTHLRREAGNPRHYKLDVANQAEKVAIEVDGGSHCALARQEQDRRKDAFLSSVGWTVLRFSNQQVLTDLDGCLSTISQSMAMRTTSRTAS